MPSYKDGIFWCAKCSEWHKKDEVYFDENGRPRCKELHNILRWRSHHKDRNGIRQKAPLMKVSFTKFPKLYLLEYWTDKDFPYEEVCGIYDPQTKVFTIDNKLNFIKKIHTIGHEFIHFVLDILSPRSCYEKFSDMFDVIDLKFTRLLYRSKDQNI